jgi:hypothetical protein
MSPLGVGAHGRARRGLVAALLVIVALCLGAYLTRQTWLRIGAESLVCESSDAPSDAILVDHVEHNYLLFERAQRLQARGLATTVLVPILGSESNDEPHSVSLGFVEVMCRIARVADCITFDAPSSEPISLNLARRSAAELQGRGVRSVLLVTSGFRSRRAFTVYSEVLGPRGISVRCQPVFGSRTPANWSGTWHGVQEVGLQFLKLWYYRLIVMP